MSDQERWGRYRMIREVDVRHFRCYERQTLLDCGRLNVFVGESGSGKTTLLESIFMPLATGTEVAIRLRQQRGLDSIFAGAPRRMEEAVWGDFFYKQDMGRPIVLTLMGDGTESRSLEITKSNGGALLPFGEGQSSPVSNTRTHGE